MQHAQAAWLPGGRLHLHHGPIDMIVGIDGPGRAGAFARAAARFETLLQELVDELPLLRRPSGKTAPRGETARRMHAATLPHADRFITPMAAVAGAGAETILAAIGEGGGVTRAHVNNGGDVAFHLAPGARMTAAIASAPPGRIALADADRVRGIASSGRGGRSHSLGIADNVTVLARGAAQADAAATMIANAVDLPGHPAITRRPADSLSPDSDLGARPVTTGLGPLDAAEIDGALCRGAALAESLFAQGLVTGAYLTLRGQVRIAGTCPPIQQKDPIHA